MNILALDTSTNVLGISLHKDSEVIGEFITNLKKNHTIRLMPAIDQLMKEVGMMPGQLDKIVVAKGPGSYTGVRIGLTTAKSLAWALNIPIIGISSLESLAYQGRFFDSYICPFFDARRGTVFTCLYKWEKTELVQVFEEQNILMKEWLKQMEESKEEILFLSPDIDIYNSMINDHLGELAIIPEKSYHLPKPSHVAIAGMQKASDHIHHLAPNYLRLAEAEAKWIESQKEKRTDE